MMPSFAKLAAVLAALPTVFAAAMPIVGGDLTNHDSFPPFVVAIAVNGTQQCGGVLLNANTVVTAAVCSEQFIDVSEMLPLFKVRAGSLAWNSGGDEVGVSRIIVNPGYSWDRKDFQNDIAVWHLASPIQAGPNIAYGTLPPPGFMPPIGAMATTAGWGATDFKLEDSPTYLRQIDYPIASLEDCQATLIPKVTSNMFCAGTAQGGKSACIGDTGSPIIDQKSKTVWGLMSWGPSDDCGGQYHYDIYVRVGNYVDWINQNKF